jgi:hypothetical protein
MCIHEVLISADPIGLGAQGDLMGVPEPVSGETVLADQIGALSYTGSGPAPSSLRRQPAYCLGSSPLLLVAQFSRRQPDDARLPRPRRAS